MRIGVASFINLIFTIVMSAHFNELENVLFLKKFKGIECKPYDR